MKPITAKSSLAARRPAPMRILRCWLFRERAVRGACAIELDVVEKQITREEEAIGQAASSAARIERHIDSVRSQVSDAMTDKISPGVVDENEARQIAQHLITVSIDAHRHAQQMEALT